MSRPLKLLSSMATRDVLIEIASRFERASGHAVIAEAGGGVDVAKRVEAFEAVDVVVLAQNAIDKLLAAGRLVAGSRVDVAKSGIAVAVRAGTVPPDLGSEEAVKSAVAAAASLSYSTGPSGVYLESLFDRWGMRAALRARIVVPPPGVPVASLVASGAAELGFQQLSELLRAPGIQVAGPLPPAIQSITIFSGAIAAISGQPEAAQALLGFMASPDVADCKERHGMTST